MNLWVSPCEVSRDAESGEGGGKEGGKRGGDWGGG